jgi:hypothetical protein
VPILEFPSDRIVGTVDCLGARETHGGAVLARGPVVTPDDREISLNVWTITQVHTDGGLSGPMDTIDVGFLTELPADAISGLTLRRVTDDSIAAIAHLAPGVVSLTLPWADLTDEAIPALAQLRNVRFWQSYGNLFTDEGVQPLAALTSLESLYLEEETLSVAAFRFCKRLPALKRLGLQDVALSQAELVQLKADLPVVAVG